MSLDLTYISELIVAEATERLETEPEAPGGLNAKLHAVLMELGLLVGQVMADSTSQRRGKSQTRR